MGSPVKAVVLVLAVIGLVSSSDPSYDHQTETYDATYSPLVESGASVSITPFFSPEHSTDTLVGLIEEATSSIDIYTPSASSWTSECGAYADDDGATCAPGCTPAEQRNETFPLFQALLNALHANITVRIITNVSVHRRHCNHACACVCVCAHMHSLTCLSRVRVGYARHRITTCLTATAPSPCSNSSP